MITKEEIVSMAREYIGVPYRHQGRSAVTGIDCAGLLTLIADRIGLKYPVGVRYTRNPETFQLKDVLDEILIPVMRTEIQEGDVLLFKIDILPQHVGIVGDYLPNKRHRLERKNKGKEGKKQDKLKQSEEYSIIHCYSKVGKVVEHRFAKIWDSKLVQAYRIPGVI